MDRGIVACQCGVVLQPLHRPGNPRGIAGIRAVRILDLRLIMDARVKPAHDAQCDGFLNLRPAARDALDLRAHDALDHAWQVVVQP